MYNKLKLASYLDNIIFICLLLYSLTYLFHFKDFLSIAFYFGILKFIICKPQIHITSKHFYFIGIFLICTFLSILFNDVSPVSTFYLSEYKSRFLNPLVGLLLIFVFEFTYKRLIILISGFSLSLLINALVVIWQFMQGNFGRPTGFVETNNYMLLCVNLLILPAALTLSLYKTKEHPYNKLRIFLLTVIIINIPAVIFENTRIVWIGLSIVFPIIIYLTLGSKIRTLFIIILLLISCFSIFQLSPSSVQRFESISNTNYTNQSNSERLLMWDSAIKMFYDHPVFGIGIGNFQEQYISNYRSPMAREKPAHPHNNFLFFLSESGILGGLSYIGLYFYLYYNTIKTYRRTKNLVTLMYLASLTAFSINMLTDCVFSSNSLEKLTYIFYLFTGIYISLNKYIRINY